MCARGGIWCHSCLLSYGYAAVWHDFVVDVVNLGMVLLMVCSIPSASTLRCSSSTVGWQLAFSQCWLARGQGWRSVRPILTRKTLRNLWISFGKIVIFTYVLVATFGVIRARFPLDTQQCGTTLSMTWSSSAWCSSWLWRFFDFFLVVLFFNGWLAVATW